MFDHYRHLGYTLLFSVPGILLLWVTPGTRKLKLALLGQSL